MESLLDIYRYMVRARFVDETEESYVKQGKAFFHMPGKGHELSAALAPYLNDTDYLACHYRDKALMIARGASAYDFFLNLFCKKDSDSQGRQMSAFLHNRSLNMISLSGPVANSALHAVGVAEELCCESHRHNKPCTSLVVCALGDGMTQEGECYEAMLYAQKRALPVLFLIENNGYAISTKTQGATFFSPADGKPVLSFCGIPITYIDGTNAEETSVCFETQIASMRKNQKPVIIVFNTERLSSHTNSDDQTVYRCESELQYALDNNDPIVNTAAYLLEQGVSCETLDAIRSEEKKAVQEAAEKALSAAEPEAVFDAKKPYTFSPQTYSGGVHEGELLTMNEAINEVLYIHLQNDSRVSLFGEDIEDPKGDVFGVTRGLSTAFPAQVHNAPLAEATILGVCAGRALAGGKPVGFIQFADFLPVAMNQLFAELGNMYWRTAGAWEVPVIVMVTCGAYRPGLGPFHASTLESMALQIPGIDVVMPSSAAEAAGLLHTAFESNRPTVFFYPKNCLNDRILATPRDAVRRNYNPLRLRRVAEGTDITLVGWGNTVSLNAQAASLLVQHGKTADVLDLCSLSPYDRDGLVNSARKTGKVLITHEDNQTCGFGGEVAAMLAEISTVQRPIMIKRLTRGDTYVPMNFSNQLDVLPSVTSITEAAVSLLGGEITWEYPNQNKNLSNDGVCIVAAVGSSPSDEQVSVIQWLVHVGDSINQGDKIAELEADKAAFDFYAPLSGVITEFFVGEGDFVDVGKPLLAVRTESAFATSAKKTVTVKTREDVGVPHITWKNNDIHAVLPVEQRTALPCGVVPVHIGIAAMEVVTGSRSIANADMQAMNSEFDGESIEKKTGIEHRYWADVEESSVTLGVNAAAQLLKKLNLTASDVDIIICATGSQVNVSPSTACLILDKLPKNPIARQPAAYDISAACSGYIYALSNAYGILSVKPHAKVLVITTEVLSRQLNMNDIGTAPIFGDAATASLICTDRTLPLLARLSPPEMSSAAEDGTVLRIPRDITEPIFMNGPAVFLAAVKNMGSILQDACTAHGITMQDLDLIVPHQANQRIINAIRQKMHLRSEQIYSNIARYGNTSSSSIPLCLQKILYEEKRSGKIGLCAFGAGFVFGACILDI